MTPIGTVPMATRTAEETDASTTTTPNGGTPVAASKEGPCYDDEFEALDDALRQCETKMPKTADLPTGMRDKLELRLAAATPTVAPGGRIELTLSFKNKSNEPLALYFSGDPTPRFEIEPIDSKGKRVDLPAGKPPKMPPPPVRDVRASRVTLAPGGTARVKVGWEAVKLRWAPDKVKTFEGRGLPRTPMGPLPAGKYTLRAVIPLVGVFEKGELEPPKVSVDVGGPS